ncbi:DUF945 family protein [Desulfocastanea catecholica]
MKKIVGGIIVLIAVAGIGAPFFSGLIMERVVKRSFNNLNTMYTENGSDASIEIVHYDRGFSSTEIEWKMKLGSLQAIYGVDEILFVDHAKHGLTGIVSTTSLDENKWFADFVNNKLSGKNPLTITTEYSFSGQIDAAIILDAFSVPLEDEVAEIKRGRAVFSCDDTLKNFSSEAFWEGFAVPQKVQADGIVISSTLEKISPYLWDGTLSLAVKKSKTDGDLEQLALVNFKGDYSVDADSEENTISVVTTFGADQLQAGPDKVDNGFVRLGIINMDIQGFEEFMKLYTEMAQSVLQDMSTAEDDPEKMTTILQEQMAQRRLQVFAAYEKLMKKGLELQISDLYAKLPAGEVKGDAAISLNQDMTFVQFVPLLQQPEQVVDIFSLQSNLRLPAELVGDNPMLLSPLYSGMPTGLFVQDGDYLSHKGETRDGKLYLNGQVVVF